jgi:hypothetical protein
MNCPALQTVHVGEPLVANAPAPQYVQVDVFPVPV